MEAVIHMNVGKVFRKTVARFTNKLHSRVLQFPEGKSYPDVIWTEPKEFQECPEVSKTMTIFTQTDYETTFNILSTFM